MNAARRGTPWIGLCAVAAGFAWGGAWVGVLAAVRLDLAGDARCGFLLLGYTALVFGSLGAFFGLLRELVRAFLRRWARRPAEAERPLSAAFLGALGGFWITLASIQAAGDALLVLAFRRELSRLALLGRAAAVLLAGAALAWLCCRPLAALAARADRRLRGAARSGLWIALACLPALVALAGAAHGDRRGRRVEAVRLDRQETGVRVLLMGLDGGTWRVLDPLMAQGSLPHLARLAQEGFAARIDSLPPQVSPALWATVVTGVAAESHGIRDYLVVRLPGVDEFAFDSLAHDRTLIPFSFVTVCLFLAGVAEGIPPSADRLAVPALWDYLDAGGESALWLGWPGTWPARRVRGLVVSDRFGPNEWDMFSSRRRPPAGSVWPAEEEAPLRARARDSRGDIGAALAGIMSFEPAELESLRALVINPLLPKPARMLADVLDADLTLLDILAERFPAGGFALGAVMFNAADLALHAFWPERFPADFGRERAAHPSRGAIVDAVLGELDRRIGEALARAGPDTVLVLLSDHGMKADPGNPVWPGWHDRDAMLLMAGGPVRSGLPRGEFDHRDVAPTVLYLLGFAVPESMSGRVRTDALDPAFVARHPVRRQPGGP